MAIKNRGFASMPIWRRKEIAAMGGRVSRGGGRRRKPEKEPALEPATTL